MIMLSSAFMMQSCDKVADLVAFNVDKTLPTQHFDLDSASTIKGETMLYESFFDINLDSILAANGVDKGTISEGKFKEIILSINNPSSKMQFGFVSSLTFVLSETEGFEAPKTFATASDIQPGDVKATFVVNNEVMDHYLEISKFYYRIYGTQISPVPVVTLPLILESKVGFTVKPLK